MTTFPELKFPSGCDHLNEDIVQVAAKLVQTNGCILLENVFSPEYIEKLRAAYIAQYSSYFEDNPRDDVLVVGNKRLQISVEVKSEFNDPHLYANPLLLPIIQKCVGKDCVIGSYGSVAALPGAPEQHVHRDGGLFGEQIDAMVPAFALTLMVPFVELNEINGTTRMWKGTHVVMSKKVDEMPYRDPKAPLGSCLLMDYRLIHAGTPNRSQEVRPILYIVYNRPWFKDYRNYRRAPAVQIGAVEYEKIAESERALFAMAQVSLAHRSAERRRVSGRTSQEMA